jgi:hypothetical protein
MYLLPLQGLSAYISLFGASQKAISRDIACEGYFWNIFTRRRIYPAINLNKQIGISVKQKTLLERKVCTSAYCCCCMKTLRRFTIVLYFIYFTINNPYCF